MYDLKISEAAQRDLSDIVEYIAGNLYNPIAAGTFLDEVEKCYNKLKENPYIYAKCDDIRLESEGYRKVHIKNYLLVFKVDDKYNTVYIYRIFYGKRDYLKLL